VTVAIPRSQALFERVRELVPAGVHSNARARDPHPLYFARAEGAHLWDVDGNRYLDCLMGSGSVALGHGHPEVDGAVQAAIATGLTAGYETRQAVAVAERIVAAVPGAQQVRLANTGTEALMHAVRIAREATGRQGIAKAEGAYHGWLDALWVSCWAPADRIGEPEAPAAPPASAGLSSEAAQTVILPFNDAEASERLLRAHADRLAVVVLEPIMIDMGFVPAAAEYLERVRAVTAELGILLLFDELLTGFRVAPGGARELYGITPDLSTYGKAIANGYPLAAVEGRADLLELTNPTSGGPVGWVGTYNGHGIATAAAEAALGVLAGGGVQRRLSALTERLQTGFDELARRYGVPARLAGGGGHFQPYFRADAVRSYRDGLAVSAEHYGILRDTLARRSVLIAEKPLLHCALSAAHMEADVDLLLEGAEEAFAGIAGGP
jgi:glutamate-1-semialdehyde 2,1-aminomutase